MIIGKWNKSVILTYVGLSLSILGIYFSFCGKILYALSCLIVAGICDLFDGAVARMCKRNKEEKEFGIQLDSLVDVVNFLVFPIIIYFNLGFDKWYCIIIYILYALCGVARLAYFNITLEEENRDKAIKYYHGLPVTFSAILIPLFYLVSYIIPNSIHTIYFIGIMFIISILFILNINIKKPSLKMYPIIAIIAILALILFLGVL